MIEEREKIFVKYCDYLSNSGMSYDIRGKYIDTVLFFLNKASEVSKRGYLSFSKQYSEYLVQYPYAKPALLHFLSSTKYAPLQKFIKCLLLLVSKPYFRLNIRCFINFKKSVIVCDIAN